MIFTVGLYQFSILGKETEGTVGLKTTTVTDDVIKWPLPNKILGCATANALYFLRRYASTVFLTT